MPHYSALFAAILLVACNTQSTAQSAADLPEGQAQPCDAATNETLMDIQFLGNDSVSICRLDGIGDCLYSAEAGRTFEAARPDFNGDDHSDILVKDFTGAYGNHDIIHFLGYAACSSDGYVKVLDTFATSAIVTDIHSASGWKDISVTRDCYDEMTQDVVSRNFTLKWDEDSREYGPPDGDIELTEYCTEKEMGLPGGL